MSSQQQLRSYINELERRLRLGTVLKGAAVLASAALVATVVLVLMANALAFSSASITLARLALAFIVIAAISFGLAIPLSRIDRRRAALEAERRFAGFEQRLVTFLERDSNEPFLELLASDTLEVAHNAEPAALAPNRMLLTLSGIGVGSLAALLWLIVAGPGFLGYGTHLLWAGEHRGAAPLYDLQVTPGDAAVRRNSDQLITAQPIGMSTSGARLYARYQSTSKWEQVAMRPQSGASGYQFVFTALPENVEYYVEAGALRSKHFNIRVVDQPEIKGIKVTYHFPTWTGLADAVEPRGGDLRAVEGTRAELDISTDRPLTSGLIALDNGQQLKLSGGDQNHYRATVDIDKDAVYHVAAIDLGQPVRLSEDFFIEARKANPPEVAIARPGRDYRASPIEEVTVAVKAQDEFGLRGVDLHYSVNGGPEQTVRLLKQSGQKQADGSTLLSLEDFKLVPGDLVSVYASARDAHAEARTDMLFVQVDPFEREFSQSQAAGGGGGGGGGQGAQPEEISQREKEIIATTFKQLNDKSAAQKQAAEAAKFLSGVQSTLRDQALSLAGRLQARELTAENQEFSDFQGEMNAAALAMGPASQQLQQLKWADAIPSEQKALQHLLRAEATFRQIQVAFGARGGGGGGGGAGRDLASLFDLELDTQKNQFETQQTASSADRRAQDVNDALQKLDELARREEELAQRRNNSAQSFEQRWQQEMLQRDAEQLRRQLEQLAGQQGSQQANQQGGQQSGQQGAQGGQGGAQQGGQQGGQQNGQQQAGQNASGQTASSQALDRLRQAESDMRRAASNPQSAADARLAAERLREAMRLLGGVQSQEASGRLGSMAREADRLVTEEKAQADEVKGLKEMTSGQAALRAVQKLADDRQKLADDLSSLEQDMRGAARELDSSQRAASDKLRSALDGVDQSDLETRLQRTADWLRTGIDPTSNGTEAQIAAGLQKLGEQIRDAQQALGSGARQDGASADANATLNNIERLRQQIEALSGQRQGDQNGQLSRNGQPGQQGQQGQQGQPGQFPQGEQGGQGGRGGNQGFQVGPGNTGQANQGGPVGPGGAGDRNNTGTWIDTGDNARNGPRAPAQATPAGDPEQAIQQGLKELNQLRQQLPNDPEVQRQVQELITAMEHLDLKRFPGNPSMVEELHQRLLSGVTTLELQVRQNLDAKKPSQIRSTDPTTAPPGYKDAVAEYFRRLSAAGGRGGQQ